MDDEGNAFYYRQHVQTGPNGASSHVTSSSAGGGLPGQGGSGNSYNEAMTQAGPDGASSSGISANSG